MPAFAIFDRLQAHGWAELAQWAITHEPEGLHLDFKQRSGTGERFDDKELAKIAKALSAFANVEGGVLVYGVRATPGQKGEQDRVQSIEPFPMVEKVAANLEHRVAGLTDPPVPGVQVIAIADPSSGGCGVVVIYAPISDGGPHQAAFGEHAGRYFIRTTSNSTPAPHSIIAAMFGRRPAPRLRLAIATDSEGIGQLHVGNVGRGTAYDACVRFALYRTKSGDAVTKIQVPGGWQGHLMPTHRGAPKFGHGLRALGPIYPQETLPLCSFGPINRDASLGVLVRLDCRDAQPVEFRERVELNAGNLVWVGGD